VGASIRGGCVGLVTFAGEVDLTTSQRRSLNQQDALFRCR
jgi:hypothetical protein